MALPTEAGSGNARVTGKLDSYKGDRDQWQSWKFAFKCYVGALSPEMLVRLNHIENSSTVVQLLALTEAEKADARQFAFLLSQTPKASALILLMNVEDQNGFEAWRRLSQREDPSTGFTQVAKLQALLKSNFRDDPVGYVGDLEAFEQRVKVYETGTGEILSDSLMQALIKEGSPPALRDYLAVQTFTNFAHLKECVVAFFAARSPAAGNSVPGGAAPMEVGGIYGGKKGGKGKTKHKGKKGKDGNKGKDGKAHQTKGGDTQFEGWCNHCGKYGHKAVYCWGEAARERGWPGEPTTAAGVAGGSNSASAGRWSGRRGVREQR